ncbi:palmitoyltransferase [Acrasis kona]|uniref:Palmitoyltransferase n=1 Tax=Acrasis kona TaxID=1008807 RepID=A0AAW2YKW9_9EUKA
MKRMDEVEPFINDSSTLHRHLNEQEKLDMQVKGRNILFSKPWYSYTMVVVVNILFLWIYISYIYNFVIPWVFYLERYYGILFLIILTVFVSLSYYSYYKCVTTHPGLVPAAWGVSETEVEAIRAEEQERAEVMERNESVLQTATPPLQDHYRYSLERTRADSLRLCLSCKQRKPDRTHHCRQCGVCILKMDHHCHWFNNCIGYYNYKYFNLFIVWTVAATLFLVTTMTRSFVEIFTYNKMDGFNFADANIIAVYFVSLFFGFSLVFFGLYHLKLILDGTTTIESLEKQKKLYAQHRCNPYDLGVTKNWAAVFGDKWYYWFLPTLRSVNGDGVHFEVSLMADAPQLQNIVVQE